MGCDQLPQQAHGKEGVDGSSPSEGFAKCLLISSFRCRQGRQEQASASTERPRAGCFVSDEASNRCCWARLRGFGLTRRRRSRRRRCGRRRVSRSPNPRDGQNRQPQQLPAPPGSGRSARPLVDQAVVHATRLLVAAVSRAQHLAGQSLWQRVPDARRAPPTSSGEPRV